MEIGLAALRLYFDTGYWDRWAQYQAADAEYHNPLIPGTVIGYCAVLRAGHNSLGCFGFERPG